MNLRSEFETVVGRFNLLSTSRVTAAPPKLDSRLKKWCSLALNSRFSHLILCLSSSKFSVRSSRLR